MSNIDFELVKMPVQSRPPLPIEALNYASKKDDLDEREGQLNKYENDLKKREAQFAKDQKRFEEIQAESKRELHREKSHLETSKSRVQERAEEIERQKFENEEQKASLCEQQYSIAEKEEEVEAKLKFINQVHDNSNLILKKMQHNLDKSTILLSSIDTMQKNISEKFISFETKMEQFFESFQEKIKNPLPTKPKATHRQDEIVFDHDYIFSLKGGEQLGECHNIDDLFYIIKRAKLHGSDLYEIFDNFTFTFAESDGSTLEVLFDQFSENSQKELMRILKKSS